MDYLQESIDKILEFIKKECSQYGHMDQATIYEELTGKMSELNQKALMDEYFGSDEYIIDGV